MHENDYFIYLKPQERSSPQKQNGHKHLNISPEDICPKTLPILAAGAEEEDAEEKDMA